MDEAHSAHCHQEGFDSRGDHPRPMCAKGTCGGGEGDSWSAVYFVIRGDALDELVHSTT